MSNKKSPVTLRHLLSMYNLFKVDFLFLKKEIVQHKKKRFCNKSNIKYMLFLNKRVNN